MPVAVLYLITELSVGGAQISLWRLLAGLDRGRFSPAVACLYNGDGAVAQAIRALNIPVYDLGMRHKVDLTALVRLYSLIRKVRPAILHTSLFHANLPGRLIGRIAGVPILINSERTMAMESEWRYRMNRWTVRWVDRVVAVSESVAEFCREHMGLPAGKLIVIHNGVPIPELTEGERTRARISLNLPDHSLAIGAASRIDPIKGLDVLLQAVERLDQNCPSQLVVMGEGPLRRELESLAEKSGVNTRVHWMGYRPDVLDLLPGLDIFVQPSLKEGLPNTVLEAMAAGLPVVATAVGGTPEIVVDGITGLLVPPADPIALAQAISRLLRDPDLRGQMGQAGRERAREGFSIKQMVANTEDLYNTLFAEKGSPG